MSPSSRKSRGCASWFPLVVATACGFGDPGWLYTPPGATPVQDNGRRYDVTGPAGLQLRVYADAFTGSLDAEVDAVGSRQPLADNTHLTLTVEDSSGRPLSPYRPIPPVSTC